MYTNLSDKLYFDPLVFQFLSGLLQLDSDSSGNAFPVIEEIVALLGALLPGDIQVEYPGPLLLDQIPYIALDPEAGIVG